MYESLSLSSSEYIQPPLQSITIQGFIQKALVRGGLIKTKHGVVGSKYWSMARSGSLMRLYIYSNLVHNAPHFLVRASVVG